jgi:hypothetical protein
MWWQANFTHLFFCSLTSCIALFFSSNAACAERMLAVCSCSVSACFLSIRM